MAFVLCFFSMKRIQNAQKELPVDILGSFLIASSTCCLGLLSFLRVFTHVAVLFVTWGGSSDGYAWNSWVCLTVLLLV